MSFAIFFWFLWLTAILIFLDITLTLILLQRFNEHLVVLPLQLQHLFFFTFIEKNREMPKLWILDKVNRCLARYSPRATTTNQPTNRAPNEPARPGKNANFGPNLVVFGQKIQIFTGESKSFGIHITEKPSKTTSFALFFGWDWDKMGQKCE